MLASGTRPVWTAAQIAEQTEVSKTTAKNRLKELVETDEVDSVKVSNATAYYVVGTETQPNRELTENERTRELIKDYWEGRLVGGLKDPSVVRTHDGEELTSGDMIQMVVTGTSPGMKTVVGVFSAEDGFDEVPSDGAFSEEQQKKNEYAGEETTAELGMDDFNSRKALISAELGGRFAVPLAERELGNFDTHAPNLEDSNTEWKFETEDGVQRLLVAGVGAYLLRPCENAVHLKNVEVVDLTDGDDGGDDEASIVDDTEMEIDVSDETRSEAVNFEDTVDE